MSGRGGGGQQPVRVGLLGLEPFLMAKVDRLLPDADISLLQSKSVDQLRLLGLDVVVVSGEHALVDQVTRWHDDPPVVVIGREPDTGSDDAIHLTRPVGSPQLQEALDRSLGVPVFQRFFRGITVEQDDHAVVERVAFAVRSGAALAAMGWTVANLARVHLWVLLALAVYAIVRALWWRLSWTTLAVDIVVTSAVTVGAVATTGTTALLVIALPLVVWAQAGYQLGWGRGLAVLVGTGVLTAGVWAFVLDVPRVGVEAAVGVLVLAAISVLAGAMAARIGREERPNRRFQLEQFRSSLYELSERQAVVALSFDLGTAAEDALARILRQAGPEAAVVLVSDRSGPLQVAAAHNLTSPPPPRMVWQPIAPTAHVDEPTGGDLPPPAPVITDGESAGPPTPTELVDEVAAQLADNLPAGDLVVLPAVLDGDVLGGVIMVDPSAELSRDDLDALVAETALAFDSVRLFNRLRAFTLDQERARIGRSLHDGVMQTLSHVAMQLDMAVHDGDVVADAAQLAQLREHVIATVGEMRTVVNDLRSVRLDRGLLAALETMAVTLTPAGGPVVTVEGEQVEAMGADAEEQLLRIAEEAVTNAIRHARATTVTVRLQVDADTVVLQVADDGFGLSADRGATTKGGVGMTSMRQRAASIGAGLDVDPGPDGAIITVTHSLRGRLGQSAVRPT